jgi:hypothetical protein
MNNTFNYIRLGKVLVPKDLSMIEEETAVVLHHPSLGEPLPIPKNVAEGQALVAFIHGTIDFSHYVNPNGVLDIYKAYNEYTNAYAKMQAPTQIPQYSAAMFGPLGDVGGSMPYLPPASQDLTSGVKLDMETIARRVREMQGK